MLGTISSMLYKFFDNKTGFGPSVNEDLAEELYISFIKKILKKENICEVQR